jgi:FtsP/CotA-like multicopper oxidase with cupredoxin domain
MQSNRARAAIGVGAIALIVVLFIVLSGGSDDNKSSSQATTPARTSSGGTATTPAPTQPAPATIVVKGAKPVGGIKKIELTKGDRARIVVRSDVADEIHVHGYDLKKDVPAGGRVSFSFPANIEGIFEIELEGRKEQIAELRVNP